MSPKIRRHLRWCGYPSGFACLSAYAATSAVDPVAQGDTFIGTQD